MRILVEEVAIPAGSTLGFAYGTTDDGTVEVIFAGDHRAMRELGEIVGESSEPVEAEVPEFAVIARRERRFR